MEDVNYFNELSPQRAFDMSLYLIIGTLVSLGRMHPSSECFMSVTKRPLIFSLIEDSSKDKDYSEDHVQKLIYVLLQKLIYVLLLEIGPEYRSQVGGGVVSGI